MNSALWFSQLSPLPLDPCTCPSCKPVAEAAVGSRHRRTWMRGCVGDLHFSPITCSSSLQGKRAASGLDFWFMEERTQTHSACFSWVVSHQNNLCLVSSDSRFFCWKSLHCCFLLNFNRVSLLCIAHLLLRIDASHNILELLDAVNLFSLRIWITLSGFTYHLLFWFAYSSPVRTVCRNHLFPCL